MGKKDAEKFESSVPVDLLTKDMVIGFGRFRLLLEKFIRLHLPGSMDSFQYVHHLFMWSYVFSTL